MCNVNKIMYCCSKFSRGLTHINSTAMMNFSKEFYVQFALASTPKFVVLDLMILYRCSYVKPNKKKITPLNLTEILHSFIYCIREIQPLTKAVHHITQHWETHNPVQEARNKKVIKAEKSCQQKAQQLHQGSAHHSAGYVKVVSCQTTSCVIGVWKTTINSRYKYCHVGRKARGECSLQASCWYVLEQGR